MIFSNTITTIWPLERILKTSKKVFSSYQLPCYQLPVTMAANLGQRRIITDEEASGLDFQVHLARKMKIYNYLILKYKYIKYSQGQEPRIIILTSLLQGPTSKFERKFEGEKDFRELFLCF